MKKCNNCNINFSDERNNCPLCGKYCDESKDNIDYLPAPYPDKDKTRSKVLALLRNIAFGISFLIIVVFGIIAIFTQNARFITYTLVILFALWLIVLQFIFWPRDLRVMFGGIIFYLCGFCLALFLYLGKVWIALDYIVPSILLILICTDSMIVFIGRKWHRYAHQIFLTSLLAVVLMVINASIGKSGANLFDGKLNAYLSIVVGMIGLTAIVCSLIFGKKILFAEIKKRYHT